MIDHIGFPVADYARSKVFNRKALAPLGYVLIMEVSRTPTTARRSDLAPTASRIFGSAAKAHSIALFTSPSSPGIA